MVTRKAPARTRSVQKTSATPAQKAVAKKATPRQALSTAVRKQAATPNKVSPGPQTTKPVKPVKATKPVKVKKPKMVRDSFTMPKDEYAVIDTLKLRGGKLGQGVKKSELLRAGIKALAAMSDIQFKAALSNVPTIKTGRPTHSK